ncbi:MAG TPA: beta-propeller fold lactonase family protein [Terriglobales bacterium]|nr:beta-propeller fold lactonase family protein [Terriglobales bacterium]
MINLLQSSPKNSLAAVLFLTLSLAACGGAYGSRSPAPVPRSLSIKPSTAVEAVGETRQFSAQVTFSDSTTRDVTSQVVWVSSPSAVATITKSGGLGSALAPGDATVSASFTASGASVAASAVLHVARGASIQSIEVSPGTNPLELGASQQFAATATLADGNTEDVTRRAAWTTSDPGVLRVNTAAGRVGLANTRGPGSATISAVVEGVSGSAPVRVVRRVAKFMYVAGPFGIDGYAVSPADGSLTSVRSARFASGEVSSLTITRDRKFLYAADVALGAIWAFQIGADGGLVQIPNSPFPTTANSSPISLLTHPAADLLFMTNFDTGEITTFTIGSDGAISPHAPVSFIGSQPLSGTTTQDGKFLYQAVQDGGSATIAGFSIGSSGAIQPLSGGRIIAGPSPKVLTVDPSSHFLYATIAGSTEDMPSAFSGYAIDHVSGLLTPIKGSPFANAENPIATAIDASGRFLYVVDSGQATDENVVSAFSIDPGSGALSPIPGASLPVSPLTQSIAIDPSAQFAYVGLSGTQGIRAFKIDQNTGALTEISGSPFVDRGDVTAMALTY